MVPWVELGTLIGYLFSEIDLSGVPIAHRPSEVMRVTALTPESTGFPRLVTVIADLPDTFSCPR